MKKQMMWALVAALLAPTAVFAKNSHPMAGCGLIYAAGLRQNKPFPQIVASLFNNFYGTQTSGITSGTAGCTEAGLVAMNVETEVYADANFNDLRREMAAGRGEFLNGFADLLGVKREKRSDLFKLLQEKYAALFPSADTTSLDMLTSLRRELAQRRDLLA